jgi:hypothetical protein
MRKRFNGVLIFDDFGICSYMNATQLILTLGFSKGIDSGRLLKLVCFFSYYSQIYSIDLIEVNVQVTNFESIPCHIYSFGINVLNVIY